MGCGGSKQDVVEVASADAAPEKKELTPEEIQKKEAEELRLAEEAAKAEVAAAEAAAAEAAAAAEEAAAAERARIRGCYLCFSEVASGTLQLVWSESAVEGALAHFTTEKTVQQHKFTTNQGRSDLIKGIGTGASSGKNTKKLLDGVAQFVKQAQNWQAELTMLSQIESRPVSVFLLSTEGVSEANIVRLQLGVPLDVSVLEQMQVVAVFNEPAGTDKMKAKYMEKKSFVSFAEREGAASLMLAAQTPQKPNGGVKGRTSAELMEKLGQQSDKAAATTVETMGAKTGAAFGIGNTVKTAAEEEASAQAAINASAGGAAKAAALKAHGNAMAAAAPAAAPAPASERV